MDSAGISFPLSTVLHRCEAVPSSCVRQLLPTPLDPADPLDLYPLDERPAPAERPWVMMNMVASADGAIAIDGVSGELGGEGDSMVFRAVRASCDWILAGAGTVRAERYRIPRPAADVADVRRRTGRTPAPRLAVVTTSVDLDGALPLFADQQPGEPKPLVITGATPPAERVEALTGRAEWAHLPTPQATPEGVMAALRTAGARVVLVEGGPSFNGQVVDAGLVDELCLTISPHLVGGPTPRIVHGSTTTAALGLRLDRLLEHEGALFARYLRA